MYYDQSIMSKKNTYSKDYRTYTSTPKFIHGKIPKGESPFFSDCETTYMYI